MVGVGRPARAGDALVLIDATSGAGGLPVDVAPGRRLLLRPAEVASPPTAGCGWRCSARPRCERIDEIAATDRWIPEFLSLRHRAGELAQGPDLQHARAGHAAAARRPGRVDARATAAWTSCVGRSRRVLRPPLRLGARPRRSPRRSSPTRPSARSSSARSTSPRRSTPPRIAATLRANGIVDTEPYRKLGRNQLRIGDVPGRSTRTTSQALTACIDCVVERHGMRVSSSPRRSATPASSCCATPASTSTSGSTGPGSTSSAHRRLRRPPDPLRDDSRRRAARARRPTSGRSAAPASASTTSTSRPRPSAASSSPTRRSPTSSPPPSTRWPCCWRWRATCPQAARLAASTAAGTARSTPASSSWTRRSGSSASAASASSSPSAPAASACASSPTTRSWAPSATASSASRRPTSSDDVYAEADFLTLHLPKTPETEGWLDAEALAKCKDGVRILNVARGPLIVDEDLQAALDSGKVGGAALDVFRSEPVTDHPLFAYPNVIVDAAPRRLDRRGHRPRGLPGRRAGRRGAQRRRGDHGGQRPGGRRRGPRGAGPVPAAVPAARAPGHARWPRAVVERVEIEFLGADRRARHAAAGHRRPARRARRPHRGGGQPGQRAADRRGARHRGRRDHATPRATSPTSCA